MHTYVVSGEKGVAMDSTPELLHPILQSGMTPQQQMMMMEMMLKMNNNNSEFSLSLFLPLSLSLSTYL